MVHKVGQLFVFGILAVLIWRALGDSEVRRAMVWAWVLAAAYAAMDEFHQGFAAGRYPSSVDVGIDSVGALLGLAALALWLGAWRVREASGVEGR